MAKSRVLNTVNIDNRIFKRVNYALEDDFEKVLLANCKKIFGKNLLINFKLKLKTGSIFKTDVKADLLMVDDEYKRWWVVEVERVKGEGWLTDHVLPQLDKITHIDYMGQNHRILKDIEHSLKESEQNYDKKKLRDLILFNPPEFLVIINDYPAAEQNWIKSLFNCSLLVVNVFRDDLENYIYVKDWRSVFEPVNIIVGRSELKKDFFIKNPSKVFDHEATFFKAIVNSRKNDIENAFVKFKIDPHDRNVVRPELSLNKGKYQIVKTKKNIILTDYK